MYVGMNFLIDAYDILTQNLSTEALGRLVIYADVMTSSSAAMKGFALHHGLAVIPRSQTKGEGKKAHGAFVYFNHTHRLLIS